MPPIRILLACPHMTKASLWKTILSQDPEIEIIGEADDAVDALLAAGSTQAAVVVIDLPPSGQEPGLYSHLLEEYPHVKVIAVSWDGSQAIKYERGIIRSQVQDTSPQSLKMMFRSLWTDEDLAWSDAAPWG